MARADLIAYHGRRRHDAHGGDPGRSVFADAALSHIKGYAGEEAFATRYHLRPDTTQRPRGDGGRDFDTPIGRVSVKTRDAVWGQDLWCLVEVREFVEGRVSPWIVFAEYDGATGIARLVGWTIDTVMRLRPMRIVNTTIGQNHWIPRALLSPMNHLAFGGLVDYAPDAYCCELHGRRRES